MDRRLRLNSKNSAFLARKLNNNNIQKNNNIVQGDLHLSENEAVITSYSEEKLCKKKKSEL